MTEELVTIAERVELSYGDYLARRVYYENAITAIMEDYLNAEKAKVTSYTSRFKREMVEAFSDAYEQGFEDGGGGSYKDNFTADDNDWLAAKMDAEIGYIGMLFQQLKDLKSEGKDAWRGEAQNRAIGYSKTLDGVYNEGKFRGARDKMLTFGGDDGQESCETCQKWKGKRHKASFWIKRGLTIYRGNQNFECGCYNCQHYYFDDDGNLFTF